MLLKIFSFSVLLVCFFKAIQSDHLTKAELFAKCGEITDLDPAEIEELNMTRPLETDDRRVKCFVRCVITGLKMMNIAGELTPDDVPDTLPYKNHVKPCADVKSEDSCERAFAFQNCMSKRIKEEEEKEKEKPQ